MKRRDTCTPGFIATISITDKVWKQCRWPRTDEWIEKMWFINTREYYLALRTDDTYHHTDLELERIMLREISQWEKDNDHMLSLLCGISETGEKTIGEGRETRMGSHQRGRKTMIDSSLSQQTDDCRRRGGGITGGGALRRSRHAMSAGCYTRPILYWRLHLKLKMNCKLANWI